MDTLRPIEARIIGCLVEKAATTPEQYPLSLNALVAACNQKSNRSPAMNLSEDAVFDAMQSLRSRGWVTMIMPTSGRVERWRHHVRDKLAIDSLQQAVLAELLLRGPQTAGEIRTRAARMKPIDSLDTALNVLDSLSRPGEPASESAEPRPALVRKIPPAPGGRAERWIQLLAPDAHPVDAPEQQRPPGADRIHEPRTPAARSAGSDAAELSTELHRMNDRLTDVEVRCLKLEQDLDSLRRELGM